MNESTLFLTIFIFVFGSICIGVGLWALARQRRQGK